MGNRARVGVVGPNGHGKTTLLRILTGELEPDAGTVTRAKRLTVGYVPQTTAHMTAGSLKDEVMKAFDEVRRLEVALASSAMEIQKAGPGDRRQAERRYSSLLQHCEAVGGYDYQNRMERVVAGVGLSPEVMETPVSSASGGERTRAALAKALLGDPDLLVLDEPTNYLDFKGLSWLEGFLSRFPHAFIVVSHDRYFLDHVVDQIWEIANGSLQSYKGNYSKYRRLKAERTRRRQIDYVRQREYIARQEAFIDRYHAGQRSREAKGREKRLARLERVEGPQRQRSISIGGVEASRTGQIVLSTQDLSVGFTDGEKRVQLLSVPDLKLERASRTAIIGSNGVGKTTLLRTILGLAPPLSGTVSLGHNVRVGYQRQGTDDLPESSSVLDALLDIKNVPVGEARSHLARFLFQGEDVFKSASSLSGGERTRLTLARLLITEPNVLILDEPTTHLDIPSREALEQVLLSYGGALVLVSHDRQLISLLAHQLWVVDDGTVRTFEGTFEEWAKTTQEPAVQVLEKRRKPQPRRRRTPTPKRAPPPDPKPDPEQVISRLESRLARIEAELQLASESQDLERIASLGEEYNSTQAELDQAWEDWEE